MAKEESIAIKDAIHKVQLSLLEGIQNENQLFSAGSLMSQSDYQDVVTERSIANMCGYPLCSNSLPAERPRKSRYRVSLKEHKVYDLHETYMYCSINCVVNSGAFAGSLQEERCSVLNSAKLNEILRLFEGMSLDSKEDLGKKGDLGFSKLMIQEKTDTKVGEVSLEEWIGPSNAIEGYVPQRERSSKPLHSKNIKKGSKANHAKLNKQKNIFNEMDFTSAIITEDEYSISKMSSGPNVVVSDTKFKEPKGKVRHKNMEDQFTILETSSSPLGRDSEGKLNESEEEKSGIVRNDDLSIPKSSLSSCQNGLKVNATKAREESHAEKAAHLGATILKPTLKHAAKTKPTRSVTWADEKTDSADSKNLCEVREFENTKYAAKRVDSKNIQDDDSSFRCASAEACAIALSQAAEAITSGESDVSDAVSEAGIIILPPPHNANEAESQENIDVLEPEPAPLKWPRKPGNTNYDLFDSEDSWYDSPPEGFNMMLSSFATMWMALFAWMSSSSLAYIYGRDESFHEEYLSINGREYPPKIIAIDGRSSEIKQTLAGCLARALPGLVAYLRLPTPISILEQGMGRLLDTMSFIDPLPPFRMKQWQVIVLLFIDALSVSRIPALTPHMTNGRTLLYKVLNGARISAEEYETMKDLILPLGRVAEFSTQKGG